MPVRPFIPTREDLRATVRLAVPVTVVQLGLMAMGVVDTIMVGHLSPADLAAVALGTLYYFAASVFGMGLLMSLDPVVSQGVGAGDDVAVARAVQRGGLLSVGLAAITSLLLVPGEWVFTLLRQPTDVVPIAAEYARATIPGVIGFYMFVSFRQSLQAMGRLRPIVIAIVVANLANIFFNWTFVFGNLGFPRLGAVGAGWASSVSRILLLATLLGLAWDLLKPYLRPLHPEVLQWRPLARMLRLGAPIGTQFSLEFGAFAVIGVLMGWLGTIAMAGHQIAINLASLTFMVPLGVAQASAVLVGHRVGAEDPPGARRAAGAGLGISVLFMTLSAVTFLIVPGPLAALYTDEPVVVGLAASLIPIAGMFQVFDGLQATAAGVLRGVADTRVPMLVNLLGFWLIGLPISYLLAFRGEGGPEGLWWGLVVGLAAVSLLLLVRMRHRFGRELRRIVIEEGHDPAQGEIHRS